MTLARLLKVDILHQMLAEGRASGLLDVQEHHHVGTVHLEGEIIFLNLLIIYHIRRILSNFIRILSNINAISIRR